MTNDLEFAWTDWWKLQKLQCVIWRSGGGEDDDGDDLGCDALWTGK